MSEDWSELSQLELNIEIGKWIKKQVWTLNNALYILAMHNPDTMKDHVIGEDVNDDRSGMLRPYRAADHDIRRSNAFMIEESDKSFLPSTGLANPNNVGANVWNVNCRRFIHWANLNFENQAKHLVAALDHYDGVDKLPPEYISDKDWNDKSVHFVKKRRNKIREIAFEYLDEHKEEVDLTDKALAAKIQPLLKPRLGQEHSIHWFVNKQPNYKIATIAWIKQKYKSRHTD